MDIAQNHILKSRGKSAKPSMNRINIVPGQVNSRNLVVRDSSKLGRLNNKHPSPRRMSKSRHPGLGKEQEESMK